VQYATLGLVIAPAVSLYIAADCSAVARRWPANNTRAESETAGCRAPKRVAARTAELPERLTRALRAQVSSAPRRSPKRAAPARR
jgi:hypothetical protein